MKRFVFAIAVFAFSLLVSLAAVGQEKQGPDLKTTVEFMNRMVEPERRMILMADECEVEVVNNMAFIFTLLTGLQAEKMRLASLAKSSPLPRSRTDF